MYDLEKNLDYMHFAEKKGFLSTEFMFISGTYLGKLK